MTINPKVISFVALLVACIFASCKKEYTCECKWNSISEETSYTTYKARKSDARAECERRMNLNYKAICHLQ